MLAFHCRKPSDGWLGKDGYWLMSLGSCGFAVCLPASRLRLWLSGFSLAPLAGAVGGKKQNPPSPPKAGGVPAYYKKEWASPRLGAIEKLFGGHLANGIVAGANLDEAGFIALLDVRLQGCAHG